MGKRIIFGGTTEGRLLAQREHDAGRNVLLPTAASISACEGAGIPNSHIIAMQGPFSARLNDALYAQLRIAVMVTKDSGEAGGVSDKVLPALSRGIHVIAIRRPQEESTCEENR